MNDRQTADLMARQLLATRASVLAARDRAVADADAQLAQLECALEIVAAMQQTAGDRAAAATVQSADELAPPAPTGPRVFNRKTIDTTSEPPAPTLAPIPAGLAAAAGRFPEVQAAPVPVASPPVVSPDQEHAS